MNLRLYLAEVCKSVDIGPSSVKPLQQQTASYEHRRQMSEKTHRMTRTTHNQQQLLQLFSRIQTIAGPQDHRKSVTCLTLIVSTLRSCYQTRVQCTVALTPTAWNSFRTSIFVIV